MFVVYAVIGRIVDVGYSDEEQCPFAEVEDAAGAIVRVYVSEADHAEFWMHMGQGGRVAMVVKEYDDGDEPFIVLKEYILIDNE